MYVVLILAFIAILVGVFAVATGRGGELAYEQVDHAPLDLGLVSATDVALLRPPTALWGYNMQVTDEALDRIARTLRDRDIEIAYLQRQLADVNHPQRDDQPLPVTESGTLDVGPQESGTLDAGPQESSPPDAGPPESGPPESSTPESSGREPGTPESAGTPESGGQEAAEEQGW